MERLFDGPARRVLADCRRAMDANREKVSGDLDGPNELGAPEAKGREEEAYQHSGANRAGWTRGLGRNASGVVDFDSRIKGDEMRPLATSAGSNLMDFTTTADEGQPADAHWNVVEIADYDWLRQAAGAQDRRGGTVLSFPRRSTQARQDWAW